MADQTYDRKALGALFLRRFAAEKAVDAAARGKQVRARRAERKAVEAPDVPDFSVAGAPRKRVPNTVDVERWWNEAMTEAFGVPRSVPWGPKERVLAKKLLGEFGAEAVQLRLAEFVASWADRDAVADRRLPSLPTLPLMWGMRQEVWAEELAGAQRNDAGGLAKKSKRATMSDKDRKREERRMVGEYNPREKDPKKWKGSEW
jgi:hypothetical protein